MEKTPVQIVDDSRLMKNYYAHIRNNIMSISVTDPSNISSALKSIENLTNAIQECDDKINKYTPWCFNKKD